MASPLSAATATAAAQQQQEECRGRTTCNTRQRRRPAAVSLLVVLLFIFAGQCAAQNITRAPASFTPFLQNVTTAAPTLATTAAPVPAPTPPVATSYGEVMSWFILQFHLDSPDPLAGIMNISQTIQFKTGLEELTKQFEPVDWDKVVTMCIVRNQENLNYDMELPILTLPPTLDVNTNVSASSILNIEAFGSAPAAENETTTIPPTTTLQEFQYSFQMRYLSSSVNASLYPSRLEEYFNANLDAMEQSLQAILGVANANLRISFMGQVAEITTAPTASTPNPTIAPTTSPVPSQSPSISNQPTRSPQPSSSPSIHPSRYPSPSPSMAPSNYPTFRVNSTDTDNFALDFTLQAPEGAGYLNTTQEDEFCALLENQTYVFAPGEASRIRTNCVFFADTYVKTIVQVPVPTPAPAPVEETQDGANRYFRRVLSSFLRKRTPSIRRTLQEETYLTTIYTYTYTFRMRYTSDSENVTDFTSIFKLHIVDNAQAFNEILTDMLGLDANNNLTLAAIATFETKSAAPTSSPMPSVSPTGVPTHRNTPFPSFKPTEAPTIPPPTTTPSNQPSDVPSSVPTIGPEESDRVIIIVVVVVVSLLATITLIGMVLFYRTRRQAQKAELMKSSLKRKASRDNIEMHNGSGHNHLSRKTTNSSQQPPYNHHQQYDHTVATSPNSHTTADLNAHYPNNAAQQMIMSPSTSESILSNPSLLSNGQGDDVDDHDDDDDDFPQAKYSTIDDFDQFKDHNMEKMRATVQESVSGMDGMMSQALTRAILGGHSDDLIGSAGIEMEANVVCEVNDWVKRHDVASFDERQAFMQEILNRMVTCVRQGTLGPDESSRCIHECAALLNLNLLNQLPNDTIILSGMRKTVRANDVIRAFRKFGSIEDAAVAANQRGFGLVRFRNPKALENAMYKFKSSEIVVQDVAVQCRVFEMQDR